MTKYLIVLLLWGANGFAQDILINEVLFNPVKHGFDYVEGYNRGSLVVDLRAISIANRNSSGEIASEKKLSKESLLIPAGSYFVITTNEKWLKEHYMMPLDVIICVTTSLPSFPDDEGSIIILNEQENIIDELHYYAKWHFELISETEGVALERINYNSPAQDKNNWTSASSPGYGTPGFQNSHFRSDLWAEGEVTIYPKLISPDNDGNNDFASISFQLSEPGYLANVIIYDMTGRRVRYFLRNELLGMNSTFIWSGENDNLNMVGSGIYILVTEIFNLQGKMKKFKNSIIIHTNLR